MIVLGLDISSFQLDACLLVDDEAPVLRREVLGKASEPLIERLRRVPKALYGVTVGKPLYARQIPGRSRYEFETVYEHIAPDWIVIEDAYGPSGKARKALDLAAGAIIASCPAESQVALIRCADWRRAIGAAKNTKECGAAQVAMWLAGPEVGWYGEIVLLDEHELDACGIALGWRKILEGQAER